MGLVAEITSGLIGRKLENLGGSNEALMLNLDDLVKKAAWVVFSVAGQGYRSSVRVGSHACKI